MKTGSVRVKPGQKVREGQLLGQVGNTGNSSTPHLHFQVLTEPTFFPSDSVPFTFSHFSLQGKVTDPFTDETLALQPNGKIPVAPSRKGARSRHAQMPLDLNVVRFAR
jgi:murein DD-endopeptidase MepM/ murein hydrolase activator NlpD